MINRPVPIDPVAGFAQFHPVLPRFHLSKFSFRKKSFVPGGPVMFSDGFTNPVLFFCSQPSFT